MTKSQIPIIVLIILLLTASSAFAFSFVVFGDNRDGDAVYKKILDKVNSDKTITFSVNTGDFVARGQESEYIKYQKMIKKSKIPIYHVMGNHDGVFGGWKFYKKYFGSDYYSFDHENSHFVVLNNAFKSSFDAKQYNWLISDLKKNKRQHTFVFFHKPTFDVSGFYGDYVMSDRQASETMMALFKKYKVEYVFTGHVHGYARAEREGIIYTITGGGGAPLYLPKNAGGFYHYVKVTVEDDKIADEVVRINDESN
ncbi:metallophosphoesterase [Candidatus Saganbacteria bacterium]|nr:metallophosphoesterase [Candidatus Saganbacteria bacterium]